jgi:hypothetical protein
MNVPLLYHYWTKLHKEYIAKRLHGCGSVNNEASEAQLIYQARAGVGISNGTVKDDSVWKTVKKYNPKYAIFDDYVHATVMTKTEKSESAAISCLDDNDMAYIEKWVDYHRAIGFDHIYIYDPSEHSDLKQWGEEKGDYVTAYQYASNCSQGDADLDCARRFGLTRNGWPFSMSMSFSCLESMQL